MMMPSLFPKTVSPANKGLCFTRSALATIILSALLCAPAKAEFQAGAAKTDITPNWFPVLVNGSMTSRSVDTVKTPLSARSAAFSDGETTIVIVVVDSCFMPRELMDRVKARASSITQLPKDRILISATHTHTAPSCAGALGTDADVKYAAFLEDRLVDAIQAPLQNLEPARIGYGEIDADSFNAVRRWVIRPDRMKVDPFGNFTVRANMHAARNWDDVIGPSGPDDPALSLISAQSLDGRPICVIANFSMHYFQDKQISADYFGLFSEGLKSRIAADGNSDAPEFVGMMSHGCSGDVWRRDYRLPPDERDEDRSIEDYTNGLLDLAISAYEDINYTIPASIAMEEARFPLDLRKPNVQRLKWAQQMVADLEDRLPQAHPEIYAREQLFLHRAPQPEIVTQAIRLGDDIAIATTPTETYALTGLKIKSASPISNTMVFDLANGAEGYIPPPEQHLLGGYNTWNARSAGLEIDAEPKIAESVIQLLEQVSGRPRRSTFEPLGAAAKNLLALKPAAYWRLDEFSGPRAKDATRNHMDALYEPKTLFYLEGPKHESFAGRQNKNRAAHFAGDRLRSRIPNLDADYSISLWFWNGMPNDGRADTGWIYSRGPDNGLGSHSEHLGIGGTSGDQGKLIFFQGAASKDRVAGTSVVDRWTWNHLAFVRSGRDVSIYLNGVEEINDDGATVAPGRLTEFFFAGRSDNHSNFEGKLDEIAVFSRALTENEVRRLARLD